MDVPVFVYSAKKKEINVLFSPNTPKWVVTATGELYFVTVDGH